MQVSIANAEFCPFLLAVFFEELYLLFDYLFCLNLRGKIEINNMYTKNPLDKH